MVLSTNDRRKYAAMFIVGLLIAFAGGMATMWSLHRSEPTQETSDDSQDEAVVSTPFDADMTARRNAIARIERRGQLDSAIAECLFLYNDCRENLGEESADTQDAANQYAWLLMKAGDFARAEELSRHSLSIALAKTPTDQKIMRTRRSTLAGVLIAQGKVDEAAAIYGNKAMPSDWGLEKTFQGKFNSDDGNAHMLVFWEAWCPHSARAMPQLEAIQQDYAKRGVDIVGLTQETQGMTDDDVRRFIKDHSISFPIVKEGGKTAGYFSARAVPSFRLIKGGRLLWEGYALTTDRVSTRMLDGLVGAR